MPKIYTVVFLFFIFVFPSQSQRLLEVINQAEKAVVSVKAFNGAGVLVKEGSGCVLSSDGMAIITAACLFDADSVLIETRGSRKFGVHSVLQVHPYANLALVKLNAGRYRDLSFLQPSRSLFKEDQEVVVFGSPGDIDGGVDFGSVSGIGNYVFFNRFGYLSVKTSSKSQGAPIVNNKGEMAGIVCAIGAEKPALSLGVALLNDSIWVTVNKSIEQFKKSQNFRSLCSPELSNGLMLLVYKEYEQSARALSVYAKQNPGDAGTLVLRSHARYLYRNTYGSREDAAMAKKLQPKGFLTYYFEGLHLYDENKKEEALLNYKICLEKKPDFAYALVERGRLQNNLRHNLEAAYSDFVAAIAADSTYGAGYYEKARFVLQHFEDKRSADKDIDNAIRLDPELPGVFVIRGTMRIEAQNYLQAISDFDKALGKEPKDMYAFFNRGIAHYNLGMKDKACKDWQSATDLGHYKAVKYLSRYCASGNRKY